MGTAVDTLDNAEMGIVLLENEEETSWPGSVASDTEFERADNGT